VPSLFCILLTVESAGSTKRWRWKKKREVIELKNEASMMMLEVDDVTWRS